jgi:hypothetical protein
VTPLECLSSGICRLRLVSWIPVPHKENVGGKEKLRNGKQATRSTPAPADCKHPRKARRTDYETGETACERCGLVLETKASSPLLDDEKIGRGPVNAAVFRSNMGSTSKGKLGDTAEPCHVDAVAAFNGNLSGTKPPVLVLTKTCSECHYENIIPIHDGPPRKCQNPKGCDALLGEYVFRYLPAALDDEEKRAGLTYEEKLRFNRFARDLQTLRQIDSPEENPIVKKALEIFSRKLLGRLSDEDAHALAQRYLAAVKHTFCQVHSRDLERLLDILIEWHGLTPLVENHTQQHPVRQLQA